MFVSILSREFCVFTWTTSAEQSDKRDHDHTHTEFAAKIVKIPMSAARKKMRENLADKAEIHAFRGVSGSVSWLAGQTRPDVSSSVPIATNSSTANSCTSLRIKHGGSQSSSASRLGP